MRQDPVRRQNTGISNRGRLVQELGYNGVQRARGTTGRDSCRRNRKERTVVTEGTKGRSSCRRGKKEGIVPEMRPPPWS